MVIMCSCIVLGTVLLTICPFVFANLNEYYQTKKNRPIRSNINSSFITGWTKATPSYELFTMSREEYLKKWNLYSFAQEREDLWLYENMFYGMKEGVIIESGALDGKQFSTSYFFEKFANWTAVHIEADPLNYEKLVINRPKSANIHAALCNKARLLHYASRLVSSATGGIVEFMSEHFLMTWHTKIYKNRNLIKDLPEVHCSPLKHFTRRLQLKHVDLWVLDVEGAEESALLGTNFDAVQIDVVMMECEDNNRNITATKINTIEKYNYVCKMWRNRNCVCKRNGFSPTSNKVLPPIYIQNGKTLLPPETFDQLPTL